MTDCRNNKCNANKSIECTVRQCAHHCDEANYCSLERIMVGTHESDTLCCSYRGKETTDSKKS